MGARDRRQGPARRRPLERGNATVELALLSPILVAIILWSNYFYEVSLARIKSAEVARFVAFERTVRTDLDTIVAEAKDRYQDLNGADRGVTLGAAYGNEITLGNVTATDVSASLGGPASHSMGGVAGALSSLVGGSADSIASVLGFDTSRGAVRVEVEFAVKNGIVPEQITWYTSGFTGTELDLRLRNSFFLYHDTWRAWQPGDNPNNSYATVENRIAQRLRNGGNSPVYPGLSQLGVSGALNAVGQVLNVLGLDFPFTDQYVRRSILVRRVTDPGRYPAAGQTRTVPGDLMYGAYWRNDSQACFGNCEPMEVRRKRGFNQNGGWNDNWAMRSYNCRGPYFQGTIRSDAPENYYAGTGNLSPSVQNARAAQYYRFGNTACR